MSKRQLSFFLLVLLGLSAFGAPVRADDVEDDDYEDETEDRAYLIVRKIVTNELVKEGTNMTVEITVYNAGTSSASDIEIADQLPADGFELLSGTLSKSISQLSAGSSAVHQYSLVPKVGGQVILESAQVTYLPTEGQENKQVVWSTRAPAIVLTTPDYIVHNVLMMGSYATLGLIRNPQQWQQLALITVLIVSVIGGRKMWTSVSQARDNQRRKKHLKEFNVAE